MLTSGMRFVYYDNIMSDNIVILMRFFFVSIYKLLYI